MNARITTNGKKFRIQIRDNPNSPWYFYTTWCSVPETKGYSAIWETRFYLCALKRLGNLYKWRSTQKEEWVPLTT